MQILNLSCLAVTQLLKHSLLPFIAVKHVKPQPLLLLLC